MFERVLLPEQHQQQCNPVFVDLCAGTSEPVRDGDICISECYAPAMCCSVCIAPHEEIHSCLAAWRAVAAMIVVLRLWNKDESIT